jgi:hypothetical protein
MRTNEKEFPSTTPLSGRVNLTSRCMCNKKKLLSFRSFLLRRDYTASFPCRRFARLIEIL